jgi:hypothetical protein
MDLPRRILGEILSISQIETDLLLHQAKFLHQFGIFMPVVRKFRTLDIIIYFQSYMHLYTFSNALKEGDIPVIHYYRRKFGFVINLQNRSCFDANNLEALIFLYSHGCKITPDSQANLIKSHKIPELIFTNMFNYTHLSHFAINAGNLSITQYYKNNDYVIRRGFNDNLHAIHHAFINKYFIYCSNLDYSLPAKLYLESHGLSQ